jgi:hypothetical protein
MVRDDEDDRRLPWDSAGEAADAVKADAPVVARSTPAARARIYCTAVRGGP